MGIRQRLLAETKPNFLNELKELLLSDECVCLNVAFDGWTFVTTKATFLLL
jgi:hypothetical protein